MVQTRDGAPVPLSVVTGRVPLNKLVRVSTFRCLISRVGGVPNCLIGPLWEITRVNPCDVLGTVPGSISKLLSLRKTHNSSYNY